MKRADQTCLSCWEPVPVASGKLCRHGMRVRVIPDLKPPLAFDDLDRPCPRCFQPSGLEPLLEEDPPPPPMTDAEKRAEHVRLQLRGEMRKRAG